MSIDLSSLFQTTPYPQNPIAQFLQIAYQAKQARTQRDEVAAERKRREELYQLQLGTAKRESQQADEQGRVDAMPAGQFAAAQGLRVTPGLEGKTIGELRRAGLLATAFERVDPRAEAQQRISGSEMLAKTFGIPSPVYGEDIRTATGYQGPLPEIQARPSISPAPGQGLASTPLEEGVMLGAPKPQRTLGQVYGDVIRPELRNTPVTLDQHGQPVSPPAHFLVPQAPLHGPAAPETPQARRSRVTTELNALRDDVRQSMQAGDPEGAATAAQDFNARLAEATKYGVAIPYKPFDVGTVTRTATSRQKKLERVPGEGGEGKPTEGKIKTTLLQKYLSGGKLTPQEERVLFGATGEDIIPARDKAILQQYRANWNTMTNEPIDPQLHEQLKPAAMQIIQRLMAPPGVAPVPAPAQPIPPRGQAPTPPSPRIPTNPQTQTQPAQKTITMAEVQQIARRRGVHPNLVIQEANKQGYMVK